MKHIRQWKISYLSELMEDVTDYSWPNAIAAHAILLCDMECGALHCGQTERIDRIC